VNAADSVCLASIWHNLDAWFNLERRRSRPRAATSPLTDAAD
jgi:hypothetical protein